MKTSPRRFFTAEEDAVLIEMADRGDPLCVIAKRIGRLSGTAHGRLELLRNRQTQAAAPAPEIRRVIKPTIVIVKNPGVVKCLGGCNQQFQSPDRLRIRICPACKRAQAHSSVAFLAEHALLI